MTGVLDATLTDAPGWLTVAAAVLTQAGDPWFLFLLATLGYWLAPPVTAEPRRVGAALVAVGLGALAVALGAKAVVAVPRPPGAATATVPGWLPPPLASVVRSAASDTGYGFPSGHAVGAAAVYGALAAFLDVGTRRRRWLAAGGIVAVVAATRVLLGLHTVGDVLGGVAIGAATLWLLVRAGRPGLRPRPDRVFFLAALLALVAVVAGVFVGGVGSDGRTTVGAAVAFGGGLGGYAVWRARGTEPEPVGPLAALAGLVVVGTPFAYAGVVVTSGLPVVFGVFPDTVPLRAVVGAASAGVSVALVVAWPTLVRWGREEWRAVRAG
ncbi:phosphatase PAP2 family protein [Halobaculum sp. MBLA0147]|uniref:phosphatase PAP2 family protein n=1 Tax=Halobaculum sp. MBLA0147 TaxID=3079934 RepID=UPI003523630C